MERGKTELVRRRHHEENELIINHGGGGTGDDRALSCDRLNLAQFHPDAAQLDLRVDAAQDPQPRALSLPHAEVACAKPETAGLEGATATATAAAAAAAAAAATAAATICRLCSVHSPPLQQPQRVILAAEPHETFSGQLRSTVITYGQLLPCKQDLAARSARVKRRVKRQVDARKRPACTRCAARLGRGACPDRLVHGHLRHPICVGDHGQPTW